MPDAITDFTARCNAIDNADDIDKTVISVIGYGSPSVPKALDLAGQKFGRLTAIKQMAPDKHGKRLWRFSCECGGELVAIGSDVKSGKSVSCGCFANEVRGKNSRDNREKVAIAKTKHGDAVLRTPEYCTWKTMRQRCNNPNNADYKDYGGRGITVCDRWNIYENFLSDMGRRPAGMSIDRSDNSLGYEPSNCRWADKFTQANNRRPRGAK